MIMHNCIYCDDFQMIPLAEGQLPVFQKYTCETCQGVQWIKHSRVDPTTYSEDMIDVNENTRSVKLKEKQRDGSQGVGEGVGEGDSSA